MTQPDRRRATAALGALALTSLLPLAARAQTLPARPLRLLVGFPPGTGPDIVARLIATALAEAGGFKIEPVHYRATGDAVTAIIAGDVAAAFVSTALGVAQVKGGRLRALATTAAARSPLLPEVPTFTEAGLAKIDFSAWFAVFAPAGTPVALLDELNRHIVAVTQAAETRSKLLDAGFSVRSTARVDTERMLKAEAQRWAAVVKATGFKAD